MGDNKYNTFTSYEKNFSKFHDVYNKAKKTKIRKNLRKHTGSNENN